MTPDKLPPMVAMSPPAKRRVGRPSGRKSVNPVRADIRADLEEDLEPLRAKLGLRSKTAVIEEAVARLRRDELGR